LVFQRSRTGRGVFRREADQQTYLRILKEQLKRYKVDLLAYCLLRDSVYLVAVPRQAGGLAKAVGRTHFSYSHYCRQSNGAAGQVWRGRFQSCALDEDYLPAAARFVEMQPVYQKLVRQPGKYPFSSAAAHLTGRDEHDVLSLSVWPTKRQRAQWAKQLARPLDAATQRLLRRYAQTGRPLGSDGFVAALEKKFHRRLKALPVGRPRKQA
jgi:putative transposase